MSTGRAPISPPALLEAWLRRRLSASPEVEFVLGDLREEYAARHRGHGTIRCSLWYAAQAASLSLGRAARPLRHPMPARNPRPGPAEMIHSLLQDLRFGLRSLRKAPVFTLAAVATLALGIGANAAMFSMVNAVLLRPLPYPEADRLVRVYSAYPERDVWRGTLSPDDFRDFRDQSRTLSSMTVFPALSLSGFVLTGGDRPERVPAHYVGEGFFETVGTPPLLGRAIGPADQIDGANRVAVLGHRTWQTRFGGDRAIVGREIVLSDDPFTVVGVMPPGFLYPSPEADLWVPLSVIPESGIPRARGIRFLSGLARLTPGVTAEEARADLATVAQRLAEAYPDSNAQLTDVAVVPLVDQMTGDTRPALLALLGAVGGVLLICCANVANLMLVRAQGRGRELSVRAALGAGRGRLARQLLTESLLLAAIGGAAGLAAGTLALRALVAVAPDDLPRLAEVALDPLVVAFVAALAVLTGLLFGLAPAWRAWRGDLRCELVLMGGVDTQARSRARGLLVVAEVALVVVLAVGAGLLLRTLGELLEVEPGFTTEGTLSMQVYAPGYRFEESGDSLRFFTAILNEVRSVPGVEAAGVVRPMPLTPDTFQGETFRFTVVGEAAPPEGQEPQAALRFVSDAAFEAMGIPLLAGRDFDARDDAEAGVMRGVVNESMVSRHFPDGDAVGRRLAAGGGEIEIVGVVGDIRQTSLVEEIANVVYVPITQSTRHGMTLVVRTRGEPMALLGGVQQAIWRVNPDQPIEQIATLDALVRRSVSEQRFAAMLVGLFAGLALLLATIGIYGVVASAVAQRNREIGIRMALGAHARDVVRWVVGQGMGWVVAGVALGLIAAVAVSRLLASLLFGVETVDPLTYGGVAGMILVVALIASFVPARRAVAVDPVRALRAD